MSSSLKICEHRVVRSIVGPSQGRCRGDGLLVEIVGGGELVVPHILHGPDITDRRRPNLLGLQICQGSSGGGFGSLGEPWQLQHLPGSSDVDFMLAERERQKIIFKSVLRGIFSIKKK